MEGLAVYFLNTKWADKNHFWFDTQPKKHIEITGGIGTVSQISRTSTQHTYVLYAKTPVTLRENTLWYPGWTLRANNNNISIFPGERGVITTKISSGFIYLDFSYEDIPIYRFLKFLGLGIFTILLCLFFGGFLGHPKDFSGKIKIPGFFKRKYKSK